MLAYKTNLRRSVAKLGKGSFFRRDLQVFGKIVLPTVTSQRLGYRKM